MAQQVACRAHRVETFDKAWGRSRTERRHYTGNLRDGGSVMLNGQQEFRNDGLTFALENAIDRTRAMIEKPLGDERGAVAADEHKTRRKRVLGEFCKIDNLRHICQIVAGEGYDVGTPVLQEREIIAVGFNLQI